MTLLPGIVEFSFTYLQNKKAKFSYVSFLDKIYLCVNRLLKL
jgi:hypothetical protein